MPLPIDLDQLDQDLEELKDAPDVFLRLNACEAFLIMAQLQLACRHPYNIGHSRIVAERVARHIQTMVATTPTLHALSENGWRLDHTDA